MPEKLNQRLAKLLIENPDLPIKVQDADGGLETLELEDVVACSVTEYANWDPYDYVRDNSMDMHDLRERMLGDLYAVLDHNGLGGDPEKVEHEAAKGVASLDWKPCILLEVGP